MSPIPVSDLPAGSFASKGRLAFVEVGGIFDERAKAAKAGGDVTEGEILGWAAMLHYDMLHRDFVDGPRDGALYDPVARYETAPDGLFVSLADWAKNAPDAWQRAGYATALFRTARIWESRGLALGKRHELAADVVRSELEAADAWLATGLEAKSRGMEFTSAWRRATAVARAFGLHGLLDAKRASIIDAARSFLDGACWWTVGALEVYAGLGAEKRASRPPLDEVRAALDLLATAETKAIETKSFQVSGSIVGTRAVLRVLSGSPRSQQDEARHAAELLMHHASSHDTHWLRAGMFNDAAQLFEQAGDRERADQLKTRSADEKRASDTKKEMKSISVSTEISHADMDAHVASIVGAFKDVETTVDKFAAHFFADQLDDPAGWIPPERGVLTELATSVTFVDDRVKQTTNPGTDEREEQELNRALMFAIGVGNIFIERAWDKVIAPVIGGVPGLAARLRPDFEEPNASIWERLARAMMDQDFLVVIHLGAPRAERVVRETLRLLGEPTLSRDHNTGGLAEKSFGDLVRGAQESGRLSNELARYLRCTLTEEWGLNLRNRVAHGLIRADECDALTAVRLLHVLFVLQRWSAAARRNAPSSPPP